MSASSWVQRVAQRLDARRRAALRSARAVATGPSPCTATIAIALTREVHARALNAPRSGALSGAHASLRGAHADAPPTRHRRRRTPHAGGGRSAGALAGRDLGERDALRVGAWPTRAMWLACALSGPALRRPRCAARAAPAQPRPRHIRRAYRAHAATLPCRWPPPRFQPSKQEGRSRRVRFIYV